MNSVVFMGVAGCGKSTVATAVAQSVGLPLVEGDDFHPADNQEKMRKGIPLTDVDRADWLNTLGQTIAHHHGGSALTCSALKRSYRDLLRSYVPDLRFVFLDVDKATALARVSARAGAHLFPPTLVTSQFATLESPVGEPGVMWVDATKPLAELTPAITDWLISTHPKEHT